MQSAYLQGHNCGPMQVLNGFVQMLGIPTIPLGITENDGKHEEVGVSYRSYFQTNPQVISSILAV